MTAKAAQAEALSWRERVFPKLAWASVKGTLLLGLFAGIYWLWLQSTVWLPVKQILVAGALQEVSSAELRDVVKPLLQDGFIRMDVRQVRDAVEAMPWVSRVTVRRQWPDTLALEVEEQRLLARWHDDGLVNLGGELFYPAKIEVDASVPRFEGIDGLSHEMAKHYQRYQQILSEVGLSIVAIRVSERHAWVVELDNEIELVLGREPQDQRIQRFINVYRTDLAEKTKQISRVDLRYSNGFSIRWKENKVG